MARKKKPVIIERLDDSAIKVIRSVKNDTIYVWKEAYAPWRDAQAVIITDLVKTNNINVVYFDDKKNPLNIPQWIMLDENGEFWTGQYCSTPWNLRARVFNNNRYQAKRYTSKATAKRAAEKMKSNGVITGYTIEPYEKNGL